MKNKTIQNKSRKYKYKYKSHRKKSIRKNRRKRGGEPSSTVNQLLLNLQNKRKLESTEASALSSQPQTNSSVLPNTSLDYMNFLENKKIDFPSVFRDIDNQLQLLHNFQGANDGTSHWTNECTISTFGKSCGNILSEHLVRECSSTEYMLDIIQKSVIGEKDYIDIVFDTNQFRKDNKTSLTNVWKNDSVYFNIVYKDTNFSQKYPKARLIMGFGPSASGKTFISETMIRIFAKALSFKKFPPSFLTIDGGVHREHSKVYTHIVKTLPSLGKGFVGLANLINPGSVTGNQIFNYDVKKQLIQYLDSQKSKNGIKLNLYIPETLSGCETTISVGPAYCLSKYAKYIKYTEDNEWIGLNIWQHKTGKVCDYADEFKCVGCTESGKVREVGEGKIYSNSNWQRSFDHGHTMILTAPGGKYEIHNSGGKKYIDSNGKEQYCKSTFVDFSEAMTIGSMTRTLREELIANNFKVDGGRSPPLPPPSLSYTI